MNFQPLYDMVLVKPDAEPEKIGSILIPEIAQSRADEPGSSRDTYTGTVVAAGPGDRHKPFASLKCPNCHQKRHYGLRTDAWYCDCPGLAITATEAAEWDRGRHPMELKVGDRVVFPRRASMPGGEFSVRIDGEMYVMFHEQQFGFGVIEA